MVELADIEPAQQVLEPSAGTGVLCDAIQAAEPTAKVFAVEINHRLCELLSQRVNPAPDAGQGICRNVLQGDFLECDGLGTFDRIVMNPPLQMGPMLTTLPMHSACSVPAAGSVPSAPTDPAK
jgi:16S rRNA A1518/A1519 N6-dimethyltransferase RsmA/KsgA/DIM1 with predicted DNA glycosylase/AP lyase activity